MHRKKHTQHGGRRGRGYKRVHTHKRGVKDCETLKFTEWTQRQEQPSGILYDIATSMGDISLIYKKRIYPSE